MAHVHALVPVEKKTSAGFLATFSVTYTGRGGSKLRLVHLNTSNF